MVLILYFLVTVSFAFYTTTMLLFYVLQEKVSQFTIFTKIIG